MCDQLVSAQSHVMAGKTECKYTSGGSTVTISASALTVSTCNAGLSKCSSAEQQQTLDYATCVQAGPTCTTGNEQAAAEGMANCLTKLSGTTPVSAACLSALN